MPSVIVQAVQPNGVKVPVRLYSGMVLNVAKQVDRRHIVLVPTKAELCSMNLEDLEILLEATCPLGTSLRGTGKGGKRVKADIVAAL